MGLLQSRANQAGGILILCKAVGGNRHESDHACTTSCAYQESSSARHQRDSDWQGLERDGIAAVPIADGTVTVHQKVCTCVLYPWNVFSSGQAQLW